MKITFDRIADAAYIQIQNEIRRGGVANTYACDPAEAGGMIFLDFDSEGRLLGIEVLGATKLMPLEVLETAIDITR